MVGTGRDGVMTDDERVDPRTPGDLGRRVSQRRLEHGLSRDELAAAAGMAPDYLRYVEEHPAAVSPAALLHLARALDTTVGDLLGGPATRPPSRRSTTPRPGLVTLSEDECRRLLGLGGVGRLVLVEARGPAAIPVNFAVLHGDVVYRTSSTSPAADVDGRAVGFEADRLDDAAHEGWSVLVTGTARRLTDPEQVSEVLRLVEPWAGEDRDVTIAVTPSELSGRRIESSPS